MSTRIRSKELRLLRDRLHYAQMQARMDLAGYKSAVANVKRIAALMRDCQARQKKAK